MESINLLANRWSARLLEESRRVAAFLQSRKVWLLSGWTFLCLLGGLVRAAKFFQDYPDLAGSARIPGLLAPSLLIAAAPWLGWFLAARAYPRRPDLKQHQFEGFLVSLAMGMLLSMVMRLATYHLAIPAMPPGAPVWAIAAFRIMTIDVALLCFMYMACFTMALRGAALFPLMLVAIWGYDLLMQLAIARYIASAGDVPAMVAGPFAELLGGNMRKVLISMVIWLPYLMLSARVNAVFRAPAWVRT